jgi:hypothetical protein
MRKSIAALWLLMSLGPGCGPAGTPRLSFKAIYYGEGFAPLPFAVGVTNNGKAVGFVDRVDAKVHGVTPIPGPGLGVAPAEDFKYRVVLFGDERAGENAVPLPAGTAMALPLDRTTDVWCALEWKLPEDAPPMLAACSVSFVLSYQDEILLETPAQAVMVQSRPGILEKMSAARVESAELAAQTVELLLGVEGERSRGLQDLLEHMQAALPEGDAGTGR